jgi:hypothetical protein
MRSVCVLLFVVAVSAPALARDHTVTVTIHSEPEGASLFLNDARTPMGITPATVTYKFSGDCARMQGGEARWTSGAVATVSAIDLCANTGKQQTVTVARPTDAPDLAGDLQVAYQRAALAQLQAQTQAIVAASAPVYTPPVLQPWVAPKPYVLCISRDVVRGVVYVSCR